MNGVKTSKDGLCLELSPLKTGEIQIMVQLDIWMRALENLGYLVGSRTRDYLHEVLVRFLSPCLIYAVSICTVEVRDLTSSEDTVVVSLKIYLFSQALQKKVKTGTAENIGGGGAGKWKVSIVCLVMRLCDSKRRLCPSARWPSCL